MPVLESWNAADHPDQRRLRAYLDEVIRLVGADALPPGEPLALELVVGLPATIAPDRGGRDLDNYLFPVVRRIGAGRVAAVFGRKLQQPESTIAVGVAARQADLPGPPQLRIRTTTSTQSPAWKHAIHEACRRVSSEPLPSGPIALYIRFGVSSRRNWSALWKPAIDALGPLLGAPDPKHPFRANDDRIVELELHRDVDDLLADDVVIDFWWRRLVP
ncbi:hypothetical protein ACFQZ8_05380 [Micromonospora azadirachtae]|uniref:Uncharacterized protein n=1 Tax=Micromonospora azadirachtae TaxID=1970735 RepID=A0ABW2ZY60_9ACTN